MLFNASHPENNVEVIPELASKLRPHQRESVQFLFDRTMGLRGFMGLVVVLALVTLVNMHADLEHGNASFDTRVPAAGAPSSSSLRRLLSEQAVVAGAAAKPRAVGGGKQGRNLLKCFNDQGPKKAAFVQYHKTGHQLSRTLSHFFQRAIDLKSFPHNGAVYNPRHDGLDVPIRSIPDGGVGIVMGPYLRTVASVDAPGARVVHFVRNPFSMVVSSFLFHRQDPPPEIWVQNYAPCLQDDTRLDEVSTYLDIPREDLKRAVETCLGIYNSTSTNYITRLRELSPFDGLRLETLRFLVYFTNPHARGGAMDPITMALAAKRLREAGGSVHTVCMADAVANPDETLRAISDFLGCTPNEDIYCAYAAKEKREIAVPKVTGKMAEGARLRAQHVTGHHLSSELKSMWLNDLRNDSVIGRILVRLEELIGCPLESKPKPITRD